MAATLKEQIALKEALQSRLDHLRIRYPRYSIRGFAKKAGISPATLSLILQGKRKVSRKLATQLSERLLFDPQERSEVFHSFLNRKAKNSEQAKETGYIQLSIDQYRLISDWRAFALLSLIKTSGFRSDRQWIAKRLGISAEEAEETIQRLKRLEMLRETGGKLQRSVSKYRTTEDVANLSLKQSHLQTVELAHASLENDPVDRRDFTWLTLPFDMSKLAAAKTLIRKFQDDFCALMEENAEPTEVYRMAIQLFPLTKTNDETRKSQ